MLRWYGGDAMDNSELNAEPGCFCECKGEDLVGSRPVVNPDQAPSYCAGWIFPTCGCMTHHDHGTMRVGGQVRADRPEQQPSETAQAAGADDHQVGASGFGEHHVVGRAGDESAVDPWARGTGGGPTGGIVDDSFSGSSPRMLNVLPDRCGRGVTDPRTCEERATTVAEDRQIAPPAGDGRR
jgi:hypothetical protein